MEKLSNPKNFQKKQKEDLIEDTPLNSTFLLEGLNLKIDKKDSAAYKLEALRIYLEKLFGCERLLILYKNFENVKDIEKLPKLS